MGVLATRHLGTDRSAFATIAATALIRTMVVASAVQPETRSAG